MELSKAPRLVPFTDGGGKSDGVGAFMGGGAGAPGGGAGGGSNADTPAVEGGVGDDGDVSGELAPDPELLELLDLAV